MARQLVAACRLDGDAVQVMGAGGLDRAEANVECEESQRFMKEGTGYAKL